MIYLKLEMLTSVADVFIYKVYDISILIKTAVLFLNN